MTIEKIWRMSVCALALSYCAPASSGTNTWTDTGPNASNVSVEFSADASIAFARGGDRFYKSTDGGLTWTTKLALNTERYSFALDPSNASVIVLQWAGFNNLELSTDGGNTFATVSSAFDANSLRFCQDGSFLYVLTTYEPYVRRSADRGTTWSSTPNTGLPAQPSGSNFLPQPRAIGIDPANANVLYVGFRDPLLDGIYKSTNGGANWAVNPGLFGVKVWAIEVSPANSAHVYAATESGLFRTLNGGTSWARVPDPSGTGVSTLSIRAVTFDRADPSILYAGGADRGEIFRSADGGANWQRRDTGVVASTVNSLSVRPGSSGQLLAGTSHTLYRSTDSAQSWTVSASGIRAANVTFVQAGTRLRAGLADGGVYESLDGTTWTPLNNAGLRASQPINRFGDIRAISEPGKLFVLMNNGGLTWSSDNGATWAPRPTTFNDLNNYLPGGFVTLNGSGPVHIATTNSGVEKTVDDGESWIPSSTGLPMGASPTVLAKNTDGSELYLGTFSHGVYKSTNGGDWVAANGNLAGPNSTYIPVLTYDETSNVLLVGTNDGAYFTRNGGTSYTALASPTPGTQASVRALLAEDFDHGAIYLATLASVYRSVDQGTTWAELSSGETSMVFDGITSLAEDAPGVLYAAHVPTGLKAFTVEPDVELLTNTLPAAGTYALGTQLHWVVSVRNNGPHAATFARFRWPAPFNVSLINVAAAGCTVTPPFVYDCDLGILQPGETKNIGVTFRGDSGGTVSLSSTANTLELDSQPDNNTFANTGVRFVEQVDLATTLAASATSVNSGDTFDYTLTIRNNGPNLVTGASFQATFDARDLYVLAQGSLAGCTGAAAGTLACPLPTLASGASATWRWIVTAIPAGARTAQATASVNADHSTDGNSANNSSTATLNVVAVNDMSLDLGASAGAVTRGSPVTYTLTATNHGVIPATGVKARLDLTPSIRFVSSTSPACIPNAAFVLCDLDPLAPGASGIATVVVEAAAPGAALVTGGVISTNPDPDSSNNSASAALTIAPVTDLGVTLTSSVASAIRDTAFSYALTATNPADSDPTTAIAHVTLSNLLTFVSASGATCTHAAGIVTCDLGSLAKGASLTVTINVTAAAAGTASSSADITGAAMDPVAANNSAAAAAVTITTPPPPPPPPSSGGGGGNSGGGGGGGGGALDYATALAMLVLTIGRARRREVVAKLP